MTYKGWQRILLLIVPYFIGVGLFQILTALLMGLPIIQPPTHLTTIQRLTITTSALVATIFILWGFVKIIDNDKFVNLGLHFKNVKKDIFYGLLIGLLIIFGGFAILYATNQIKISKFEVNITEIIYSFLLFVVVAITEELLCRGYILRNLMLSFNKYVALVISAVIFALLHIANPNLNILSLIDLFLAGIFLGISYIYTKNLWFPIALHFSWNFFESLFGFNVSGQNTYSIIHLQINENNIFNVGEFGFEGSVLSIGFQIIAILLIYVYFEKKPFASAHPD